MSNLDRLAPPWLLDLPGARQLCTCFALVNRRVNGVNDEADQGRGRANEQGPQGLDGSSPAAILRPCQTAGFFVNGVRGHRRAFDLIPTLTRVLLDWRRWVVVS